MNVGGSPHLHPKLYPTNFGKNQLVVLFAHTLGTTIAQCQFYNKIQDQILLLYDV